MQIRRANTFFTIEQQFFQKAIKPTRHKATLTRYTHALKPSRKLSRQQTVHIKLSEDLHESLPSRTKKMLRRAEKEGYVVTQTTMPTIDQLNGFYDFYGAFAKMKNTIGISIFNKKTLQLLLQQQAVLFSSVANTEGEILCYRIDIINGQSALSYYVATWPYTLREDIKQQVRYANRYLWWQNLLYLRENNYVLYDTGGLTNDVMIAQFKQSFGGQVVDVYSGYVAHSTIGRMMLALKHWRE
ncbi:hypothetical protein [Solibacillus sp. CAU 1738]|uniref:hypothetical protein n=1 Tax=Solibacillus sp. CAU 1738 TaxID=3140363 RepID=UPI003260DFBD